jgi:adenylate cyclase class 1
MKHAGGARQAWPCQLDIALEKMQLKPLTVDTEIRAIKQRFLMLNRERLNRVQEVLRWRQRDFLDLLPLLFHLNHPLLPGFVSKDTPSGVSDYTPPQKTLDAAKRFAKTFEYKKRALRTHDIHSIFLMGSTGTVAYSEKSDFDLWLCHRPDLGAAQVAQLQQRCHLVEQWTASLGLEVHIFLMNAETFKSGEVVTLSGESSGTAQHNLLLEEFYRTGLLVAGRYPAWWLVPPEHEADYDDYLGSLVRRRFVNVNEIIDFGGLSTIPPEEFFGAALWQLYKGIDSPYKSVLKIMLMEIYAQEFPDIDLLSARFKRAIYAGEIGLDKLDPYVMLIDKLEDYTNRRGDPQRTELVRRCFYFKVNLPLSQGANSKQLEWQRELMEALVARWNWNSTYLAILDTRNSWKIERVLKERKILVDELTNSYMFLSDFARKTARLTQISQRDLTILGRKLYGAFERKAGKIEIVNRGIVPDLIETHLALQESTGADGQESWTLLHHGDSPLNQAGGEAVLKRAGRAFGLIAWSHFNKLINPQTMLAVREQSSELNVRELRAIIACLEEAFPAGELPHISMEALSRPPAVASAMIFVNVGVDPMGKRKRQGGDIISNRTDVLKYSGFAMNLALSFDVLFVTTWQEVLHFSYQDIAGLMDCLQQYLQWGAGEGGQRAIPPPPRAFSFSSNHGPAIAKRIEELFADTLDAFYGEAASENGSYVLQCEQSFFVLRREQGSFGHVRKDTLPDLMRYLGESRPQFAALHVDRFALTESVIPTLSLVNRPGVIQFFYERAGKHVDVHVLDENGALFHHRTLFFDETTLVNHYDSFFDVVRQRIRNSVAESDLAVQFFEIVRGKTSRYELQTRHSTRDFAPRRYFNVQVISAPGPDNNQFSIFCDEKEFSTFEYGAALFHEVAKFVLSLRRSGLRYPIHITDIDLTANLMNDKSANPWQTVNFLNYKKRIEDRLNQEMEKL